LHRIVWPTALLLAVYLLVQGEYASASHLCWIVSCQGKLFCELEHRTALWFRKGIHGLGFLYILVSLYVISRVFAFARQRHRHSHGARRGLLYAATIMVVQLLNVVYKSGTSLVAFPQGADVFVTSTPPLAGVLNMLVVHDESSEYADSLW